MLDQPSGETALGHGIDGKLQAKSIDEAIGRLAERQYGVVARRQVLELGVGPGAIDHRLSRRRLWKVHRGVYAVGHRVLGREGRWMAAVLSGGEGATLSHNAAAALWGIRVAANGPIDVAVPKAMHRRPAVKFHHLRLPGDEITLHRRIPTTNPTRTLFDLASALSVRQLERALGEVEMRQLWDQLSLVDLLDRYPHHRGVKTIRQLLEADAGAAVTRSDFEAAFLTFLDGTRLPRPQTNARLVLDNGVVEIDCLWRKQRIAVELDGHAYHGHRLAFEADRERDRVLQAAGWRVVRITWRQLKRGYKEIEADLRRLLDRDCA